MSRSIKTDAKIQRVRERRKRADEMLSAMDLSETMPGKVCREFDALYPKLKDNFRSILSR